MFDNMSSQKRTVIAVVISIVFFIVYDFLVPRSTIEVEMPKEEINTVVVKTEEQPIKSSEKSEKILSVIKTQNYTIKINTYGEISDFILEDDKFLDTDNQHLNLISKKSAIKPLSVIFYDKDFNIAYNNNEFVSNKNEISANEDLVLSKNVNGVLVTKTIRFNDEGFYSVKINFSDNLSRKFVITPGVRPDILADSYTIHGAIVYNTDDTKTTYEDGSIKKDEEVIANNSLIAAFFDRYYVSLFYNFQNPMNVILKSNQNDLIGYISGDNNSEFFAYIGPKDFKKLESVDARLSQIIDYGWFSFIAQPMFKLLYLIYSYVSNWGWSIVLLTILIRVLMFPLTYKSMVSMQKLKVLAPKIKEIQEKYKGEPQKMQMHMMELYKKHKANPLGGCLPILLQIPIFFAIYRVLLYSIELKAAPWALWIVDLAAHDPFYVLPIYMGATMFLQQVITPMTIQDPMQAKIMKFLPLIFVIFFINFPAGLTLYWCVNNTFSLLQQLFINKIFKRSGNDN